MRIEEFIQNLTKEDLEFINREFEKKESRVPTFQFSKIRDSELNTLFDIEKKISHNRFDKWFNNPTKISKEIEEFLKELIIENRDLVNDYNEEDLKINLIVPILKKVKFKSFEKEFRDFYELPFIYKTDNFIFKGTVDFVVAKGLFNAKKPYFFIQEFKKAEEFSNPRPQLLAEMISAIELNDTQTIKGAFIIGAIWNFVIVEKIATNKYHYFVSENFDSTKIEELKKIYNYLVFVKNEIVEMIENENSD